MSEYQEYPIVTKFVQNHDERYKIDVVRIMTNGPGPMETWQVLCAANYSTGKELRIAVRDISKNKFTSQLFEKAYDGAEKHEIAVGVPAQPMWPQMGTSLDVRVVRHRMPEEFNNYQDRHKEKMIADMIYLFMYPESTHRFPMVLEFRKSGQISNYKYSMERPSFLSHPDLFSFDETAPIIP